MRRVLLPLLVVALVAPVVPAADEAAAVVVRGGRFGALQLAERDEVDPNDNLERFLVLTSAGPLVVEVRVTVDGQPFRVGREALVDEQLRAADADGDGQPTWDEALGNPRFAYGRLAYFAQLSEEQRRQQLDQLRQASDANADGLVDRGEVRRLIAQQFGGPTFLVNGFDFQAQGRDAARTLLDTSGDGALGPDELSAAGDRLKARDADDNDVLLPQEITGAGGPYGFYGGQRQVAFGQQGTAHVLALGPTADFSQVLSALVARYGAGEPGRVRAGPPLLAALVDALDTNGDEVADVAEAAELNTMRPHLELDVNLGQTTAAPAGPSVTALAPGLGVLRAAGEGGENPVLRLAGAETTFSTSDNAMAFNLDAQVQSLMGQLDSDKNGYIEKTELEGNNQGFAAQVEAWDEDADGKVFPEELSRYFDRQYAPFRTQVSVSVGVEPDPVFAALDANGDGRVGLREMRAAHGRLLALDAGGDGTIGADDVPERIEVRLGRGPALFASPGGARLVVGLGGVGRGRQAPEVGSDAPDWFVRMDRNGDGDVTPREFLGTPEQFAQLDANADEFIDAPEAAAAK